jgi:hypothetical protein
MKTKRDQILEYLENHPGDKKGASIAHDCTIQYVNAVIRNPARGTKKGKRSKLKEEVLALSINEIGFDGKGEPVIWEFKGLKRALEDKRITLSMSQLTKIMNRVGFKSEEIMLKFKSTSWYKWDRWKDKKEARKMGNLILMLDVIENKLECKEGLNKHALQSRDNRMKNEASTHYYLFMTMRSELFILAKFGEAKDTIKTALFSILAYFKKHDRTNKLVIVVPNLIEQVSEELSRFLKENESRIVLRKTDYGLVKTELFPDRYKPKKRVFVTKKEKEEQKERKLREKIDGMSYTELMAFIEEDETLNDPIL